MSAPLFRLFAPVLFTCAAALSAQAATVLEAGQTTVRLYADASCDRSYCFLGDQTKTVIVPEGLEILSIDADLGGDNAASFWIDYTDLTGASTILPFSSYSDTPALSAGTYALTLLAGPGTWGYTYATADVRFDVAAAAAARAALVTTPLPAPLLLLGGALLALAGGRAITFKDASVPAV